MNIKSLYGQFIFSKIIVILVNEANIIAVQL